MPVIAEPHSYVNTMHCRACRATYMREYMQRPEAGAKDRARANRRYRERPDDWKNYDLQRKYGITLADKNAMLAAQHGVCAICQRPERAARQGTTLSLSVDHDHATGALRGLLCADCNRGLGLFGESITALQAAIAYLIHHRPTARPISPERA